MMEGEPAYMARLSPLTAQAKDLQHKRDMAAAKLLASDGVVIRVGGPPPPEHGD